MGALSALLLACSSKDRPPVFVAPDGGGTHLVRPGDPFGDSTMDGDGSAGDADGGDTSAPPTAGASIGKLDPNAVYLIAQARVFQDLGLSSADTPQTWSAGMDRDDEFGHFWIRNGALLHGRPNEAIRTFTADFQGPPDPAARLDSTAFEKNDAVIDTATCAGASTSTSAGPATFFVGPTGRLLYQCDDQGPLYEDGKIVFDNQTHYFLALGAGDELLTSKFEVISMADGAVHATGLTSVDAYRADGQGFDVAVEQIDGSVELDQLDAQGNVKKLGTYAGLPTGYLTYSAALTPSHVLYQIAQSGKDMFIYQRSLNGTPTMIYKQELNSSLVLAPPTGNWGAGLLITGP